MKLIEQVKRSDFLKHNAIFFIGSVAVGALNYAYYPVLGRLMDPAMFGEVQVLISLFLQFTIFLNVLSMITVNITVNHADSQKAHRIIFELEKLAVYGAGALLALSILGGEFLREALHFESTMPFIALALALLTSIPLTFRSSFARGKKRFGVASISQLISATAKIAFSSALVIAGLGVTGAILGIVAAQLIAFLYAARYAARLGFSRGPKSHYGRLPDLKSIVPELKYAGVALGGLLSITLLMSIDVIIVKHFFDAHTAGLYAGIATVGRIVFFLAVPVSQVLMPMVKVDQPLRQNRLLLLKSLGLTTLICGVALATCISNPELVVRLLMGVEYITYSSLLPPLMLAIFLLSIVSLIMMYCLALHDKMITLIGIIGFTASVCFMLTWHDNLHAVVHSMLAGSILTLGLAGTYVLVNLKRGYRNAKQNNLNSHSNLQ